MNNGYTPEETVKLLNEWNTITGKAPTMLRNIVFNPFSRTEINQLSRMANSGYIPFLLFAVLPTVLWVLIVDPQGRSLQVPVLLSLFLFLFVGLHFLLSALFLCLAIIPNQPRFAMFWQISFETCLFLAAMAFPFMLFDIFMQIDGFISAPSRVAGAVVLFIAILYCNKLSGFIDGVHLAGRLLLPLVLFLFQLRMINLF